MRTNQHKAPTMQDVAARAGVTRVTASAVINGKMFGTRVSESTRVRILQAAKDLKYTRNEVANALKNGRTNTVGFFDVYNAISLPNEFIAALLSGILNCCIASRKDLLIHGYVNPADNENQLAFLGGKIDGLILLAGEEHPVADYLSTSYLPVVAVADVLPMFPSVTVDDFDGGQQQARYLAERGRRRVMYRQSQFPFPSAIHRFQGFMHAAQASGLDVTQTVVYNDHRLEENEIVFLKSCRAQPGAVVGWNDRAIWTVANYCREMNLRFPQEVALLGFDGFRNPTGLPQELTTIVAPWADVAYTATTLLLALINGEDVPRETILPVSLRVGETA